MSTFSGEVAEDRLARLEKEVERLSGLVRNSGQTVQSLTWLIIGGAVLGIAFLVALHEMGMLKLDSITVESPRQSNRTNSASTTGKVTAYCSWTRTSSAIPTWCSWT